MTDDDRRFAYGSDEVKGCLCPAATAGYQPSKEDESNQIAIVFDRLICRDGSLLQERLDDGKHINRGVVSEKHARKMWFKAIDELEVLENYENAQVGKDIADELGWSR